MGLARMIRKHARLKNRDDLLELGAFVRSRASERASEFGGRKRCDYWLIAYRTKMLGNNVCDAVAKPAHRLLVEIER
jgi:hypothetical protein